jgi:UDP-glucose 4-epimerase
VEFLPERQGEAENTLANIEKAKKLLNFKPQKNIKNWILEQIKK